MTATPVITGISPDTGVSSTDGITNTGTLTVFGTADAATSIDIYNSGTLIGTGIADDEGDWSVMLASVLAPGDYALTAIASDAPSSPSNVFAVDVDETAPTVVSDTRIDANPAPGGTEQFSVVFSEAVSGVSTNSFVPTTSGTVGGDLDQVIGSGTTYTVTVDNVVPGASGGTLRLDLAAAGVNGIEDTAGNQPAAYTGGQSYTFGAPPVVTSIITDSPNPTAGGSINFEVEFSQGVSGVDPTDFALTTTGNSSGSVGDVEELGGTGKDYRIVVDDVSGVGTLRLDLNNAGPSIVNSSGEAVEQNFTSGQTFTVSPATFNVTVYADSNGDGVRDNGETGLSGVPVDLMDDVSGVTVSLVTDANGDVSFTDLPGDPYEVSVENPSGDVVTQTINIDTANSLGAGSVASATEGVIPAPVVTEALVSDTGASASDGITSDDDLIGTSDPGGVVTLTVDGATFATTTADASGNWSFTPVSLAQGTHTIVASEPGFDGTLGSASLDITYDTMAPAVTEALVSDTGASSSDGITSDDALTGMGDPNAVVTITESANTLGFATADASGNWNFTPASLTDGSYTVVASETDLAGNIGTASLSFTYDAIAPVVTEALVSDTGASSSDGITSDDALTGTADPNAVVTIAESANTLGFATADASGNWSFTPASLTDGSYTVVASETDLAGNVGTASLGFTYDTTAPAVEVSLFNDTGSSNSDNITSNDRLQGNADPYSTVHLTINGASFTTTTGQGDEWEYTPTSTHPGVITVTASDTDLAGNIGSASLTFVFDPDPPDVSVALVDDTGRDPHDDITSDGALTGVADPYGTVDLTINGGPTFTVTPDASGTWSFTPTSLPQGDISVEAQETDLAGKSGSGSLDFTYDTVAPTVTVALVSDTGSSSSDGITSDDALTGGGDPNETAIITSGGVTLGSTVADASGTWLFTPASLPAGVNTITASETDAAGNSASATLSFTYTPVPPPVTEALVGDTGSSSSDGITSDDAVTGGGNPNATVTLIVDGGAPVTTTADGSGNWNFTPASLPQGANTIVASETDIAGNVGTASLSFTYDTIAPAVTEALVSDTGASSSDNVTSKDAVTGGGDPNATVSLSVDGGARVATTANAAGVWSFTPASLPQGLNTIVASETDLAGNVGTASLTFTYDTVPPPVTIALVSDTGVSSSDKITANDKLTGGGDPNATVTLKEGAATLGTATANAAGVWTFAPASLPQGLNTIVASETDLAGNVGTASLTFTFDSAIPTVQGPTPSTATLGKLQGSVLSQLFGYGLTAKTPVATFAAGGGQPNDLYGFTLSGPGAGAFTLVASGATATLSTGNAAVTGAPGGKLYALSVQATDLTSGVAAAATPMNVVVSSGFDDTINLAMGTKNLGINPATPTFIYAQGFADTVNAAGMTGKVYVAGGAAGDSFTGGGGVNDYLFGATFDSPSIAADDITNFNVAKDLIDLTGIGSTALTFQPGQLLGNKVAKDTIAWQQSGKNKFVYVNASGGTETTGNTDMLLRLNGDLTLTANNFLHH